MKRILIVFFLMFAVVSMAIAADGPELVPNGTYEGSGGDLTGTTGIAGAGAVTVLLDSITPLAGNYSVKAVITASGTDPHINIACSTLVAGQYYRLSFVGKSDAPMTAHVLPRVNDMGNSDLNKVVSFTTDSTFYTYAFKARYAHTMIQFFYFSGSGTFCIDNISINAIDSLQVYYARGDGVCPLDSIENATDPSSAAMALSMASVRATTFAPGDSVYFSSLGGPYTTGLVPLGGGADSTHYVYFVGLSDSTGGAKPLIDVSGTSAANGIQVSALNYVDISNFRVKGSGNAAAVEWTGDGGKLGNGYTIRLRSIDVISNLTARGGWDGFASGSGVNESAQAELWDITARNCRDAGPSYTSSHQALSGHSYTKNRVHKASFDSCNYGILNTAGTEMTIDSLTVTNPLIAALAFPATGYDSLSVTITNSTISVGGAANSGAKLIGGGAASCDSAATITISNSTINVTDPTTASSWVNGRLVLSDNLIKISKTSYYSLRDQTTGAFVDNGNIWRFSGMYRLRY